MSEFKSPPTSGTPGATVGPGSSTDNAITRWDGTTGEQLQNSSATLNDSGEVTAAGYTDSSLTADRAVVSNGSKKLISSAVTATELGYVSGATSSIQTQLNTNATAVSDHLSDTADAHDASAISNIPSGNLSATDLQAAVNELQTDIDTNTTNISNHLSDATDAHDASAISSVASGNLAATDVQAALNELQSDIDTRATSTALSNHESDTSTHGVAVAIVGTTDTQTLSNKTLTAPLLSTPTITGGGTIRGDLLLQNTSGSQPTLQLSEDPDNGTHKVIIQAPAALSADYTLTLPTDDGAVNQVLQTDGSGGLGWATVALSVTTTEGDLIYRGASVDQRLAGNTAAREKVLVQTGTGSASAAPSWDFTIDDGLNIVGFLDTTALGSNVTLTIDDNLDRSYTLSTSRNITLPTTSVKKGMKVRIESRSAFELAVLASGGSTLNVAGGCNREASPTKGFVVLEALQDAPTTPAHWWVSEVYSYGSFTGTLTGCTTSPTQTFYYHRYNDMVTISPAGSLVATSNTTACTITGMPSHIRPANTRKLLAEVQNNGLPASGLWEIASSGTITLRSDPSGSGFTASGTKGLGQGTDVSYSLI